MSLFYFITFLAVMSFFGITNSVANRMPATDPQVVFMETMRRKLELSLKEGKLENILPLAEIGQKIAETMSPINTTGISTDGFVIAKHQKLELFFDFSSLQTAESKQVTIASVFLPQITSPYQQHEEEERYELGLLMTVSPLFKNNAIKRKRATIEWNRTANCLRIDVTTPIQKLLKQLCGTKVEPRERIGKLTIEIKSIKTISSSSLLGKESSMCMDLANTNVSKPFLVLDYTREEVVSGGSPTSIIRRQDDLSSIELRKMYKRRTARSTSMNSKNNDSCTIRDLYVDLSAILPGLNIVSNQTVNIRDCSGRCYKNDLVFHSVFKRYHLLLNDTIFEDDSEDEVSGSCCTPAKLSNTVILVRNDLGYRLLTVPGAIVDSCWCIYK